MELYVNAPEIDAANLYGDGGNLGEMLVEDVTSARETAAELYPCLLAEPKQ